MDIKEKLRVRKEKSQGAGEIILLIDSTEGQIFDTIYKIYNISRGHTYDGISKSWVEDYTEPLI